MLCQTLNALRRDSSSHSALFADEAHGILGETLVDGLRLDLRLPPVLVRLCEQLVERSVSVSSSSSAAGAGGARVGATAARARAAARPRARPRPRARAGGRRRTRRHPRPARASPRPPNRRRPRPSARPPRPPTLRAPGALGAPAPLAANLAGGPHGTGNGRRRRARRRRSFPTRARARGRARACVSSGRWTSFQTVCGALGLQRGADRPTDRAPTPARGAPGRTWGLVTARPRPAPGVPGST